MHLSLHMYVWIYTQYFSQWGRSSVQYHKRPKHRDHVEDDVTQKRTRGHSKRFDQRHTACNYCSDKYTSSCAGREKDIMHNNDRGQPGVHILRPTSLYLSLHVWVVLYQIKLQQRDQLCVGRRKLPWHWICQERHYQEPEMSHPQHIYQSRKIYVPTKITIISQW